MPPLGWLLLAGAALGVMYSALALRERRRARRLVEEWHRYVENQTRADERLFLVEGQLTDLDAARPDYFADEPSWRGRAEEERA